MEWKEIRTELLKLNELAQQALWTDSLRAGLHEESGRQIVKAMEIVNPHQVTWEEIHRRIAEIEEKLPGFEVLWWQGRETYILVPRTGNREEP